MKVIRRLQFMLAGVMALAFALGATRAPAALAHTRVEIGPYLLVIGWANEPVIVGERNALTIEVTEDEAPVEGVEATLQVEVLYAGRSYRANLRPDGEPGHYSAEIFPTVRGQYEVRLTGAIEDLAVDETVEPEEVLGGEVLQFPETQPDPHELQNSINELEDRLNQANTLAIGGIAVGVLGLGLAAFSLIRKR